MDYGDYKVPADSIEYNTYYFKLKDNQLRNTAGKETNLHFTGGILKGKTNSNVTVSNVFSKSGFFANAHGLEIRNSQIDFDKSSRDIDLPYQQVNHFKVTGRSVLFLNSGNIELNAGYQNNLRKEFSEAVSHGYMPKPPDSLERQFNKHTGTLHLKWQGQLFDRHHLSAGLNSEFQHNRSGGWGFILPGFEQSTAGVFVTDRFHISEKLILSGGIRFDLGEIHVNEYYDWFFTPVMGEGDSVQYEKIQRAATLNRLFRSNSWSMGLNYNPESFRLRVNLGKSFRMPTVKELAANGINYHFFRYEKGDPSLQPEVSYQLDAGWDMKKGKSEISVTPFFNYFPNYIYLNPTYEYQEGMQVYFYRESQVVRSGGELRLAHSFSRHIESLVTGEYIYSRQLTGDKKDFSLPFSPPPSVLFSVKLRPGQSKTLTNSFFAVDLRVVARQNEIVPPEQKTSGYQVVHLSGGTSLQWKQQTIVVHLQVQNLFNSRYLDHISYYRPIGVPEPGRNFGIHVQIPFETNLK
jgi:iron complex outermembrane recepter protein